MTEPNEPDLIHAFRNTGDSETFERLVSPYQRRMYSVAVSILRNQADAMDAVQDAAIRAFQNIDSLADPSKFGGWLMRIVFGCSIDLLRRRESHTHESLEATPDPPTSSNQRPGDRVDAAEWSKQLCDAIDSLPSHYRQPLILFHLDGLSTKQVATHLDVPDGTARSLLTRARNQLADTLSQDSTEIPNMANEVFQEHAQAGGLLSQHTDR